MCEQLSKAFVMLTALWVIFSRWACYLFFYCFSVLFWILHIAELSVALGKYFRTDGAENLHKHQNVKLNISRLETSPAAGPLFASKHCINGNGWSKHHPSPSHTPASPWLPKLGLQPQGLPQHVSWLESRGLFLQVIGCVFSYKQAHFCMDGVIDIFPKKSFKVILYICNHSTAKLGDHRRWQSSACSEMFNHPSSPAVSPYLPDLTLGSWAGRHNCNPPYIWSWTCPVGYT